MTDPTAALSEHFLGLPMDDPRLVRVLASLDATVSWEEDEGISHWVSHSAGVDLQADTEDNQLMTVFFFNGGVERHQTYAGPLPRGLDLSWDRARVVGHVGAPLLSGPQHDCWQCDNHRLYVQYDASGRIKRITVSTK